MSFLYFICLSTILFASHNRCPNENVRITRPDLDTSYVSESGHFIIHYDLSGSNAPSMSDSDSNGVPDYIENAAEAADSARYILTNVMGYIPEIDDEDGKFDIYIVNLSSSLWGVCQAEAGGASFIKIRNTFQGMSDYCNSQTELLWLTIGHEFFHAIQNAYRLNTTGLFESSYFRELTAMWFENVFVPDCYDFLDFVDMNSYSLFNNPQKEFDEELTGNRGYSMALYGHYLSTVVDDIVSDEQTSSTIIRQIWENFSDGGTVFSSLKNVLEGSPYNTSFSNTWLDFMSRNMLCGKFNDMNNSIYYNSGQSLINPPSVNINSISTSSVYTDQITIKDNAVSIVAYNSDFLLNVDAEFIGSSPWIGTLIKENSLTSISDEIIIDLFDFDDFNPFYFIFSNNNGVNQLDVNLSISIEGCIDSYAINYNSVAIEDDGSCIFPTVSNLIALYPNPINLNKNPLKIVYDLETDANLSLKILDLNGKTVSSDSFNLVYGRNNISYNTRLDLPSGIYFLQTTVGGKIDAVKFINIR